jgi:ABC-type phosphate transport system auxiliary subunit
MMQSSATTRSVASVDNQVKKIVAEKEALNAQRRRIQIAGDLEREAMSLEQAAIKAANKGVEVGDNLIDQIPNIQLVASQGRTMNTALVLGAIALGVIAATMLARR